MLRSRIGRIARELDEQIDPAIRMAAERIEAEAKNRVPVNTGALRDAIHVEREGDGSYVVVAGDSKAFYGHIVEHGGAHTPAHPFLVPAAESVRDNIDDLIRAALKDL